jgi:hypothetical protein
MEVVVVVHFFHDHFFQCVSAQTSFIGWLPRHLSKWRKKRRTHCQLGHLSGRGQNFLFWGNKSRERGKRGRIASWAICQEEAKLPFWGGYKIRGELAKTNSVSV